MQMCANGAEPCCTTRISHRSQHTQPDFFNAAWVKCPNFDPLDGGVDAQVLFLFEKPGPMTVGDDGSGFISRKNDDPTAEATFEFMSRAGIPRHLTVTWNLIPWWNGTRKVTRLEIEDALKF